MTVVIDLSGAADDDALPTVRLALDPEAARREIVDRLGLHPGAGVERIEVVRHKPGRRAIVEYRIVEPHGEGTEALVALGKVRVKRYGKSGFRRLRSFWDTGFDASSSDGMSVPEPLGTIPAFRIWLQRRVPGLPVTDVLATAEGVTVARRAAEMAHKVHVAGVATEATHDLEDEARILRECLAHVPQWFPELSGRLDRLLRRCELRVASARPNRPCGIHRDYYGDQVLIDEGRAWLLDLDLYCLGDPAVDAGNFLGHITEQSIRTTGKSDALAHVETALRERFLALEGDRVAPMVDLYADLTLARHVYLSAARPERRAHTPAILDACEERFGL